MLGFMRVTTMQRQQDMNGGRSLRLGLLGVSMLGILTGCGLFDSSAPAESTKARPGADRQVVVSGSLPSAAAGQQYDAGITAVDETRSGPKIGSIVADKGGQKAQKEALEKEANERDAKAREQRQERAAADREAKGKAPPAGGPAGPAPAGAAPAGEAPAVRADAAPPSAAPSAGPGPVTAAPIPPPSAEPAAAPATAAPERSP
jgi:hypothetical protein